MKTKLVLEEYGGETYLILPNEILSSVGISAGTVVDISVNEGNLVIQSIESIKNNAEKRINNGCFKFKAVRNTSKGRYRDF